MPDVEACPASELAMEVGGVLGQSCSSSCCCRWLGGFGITILQVIAFQYCRLVCRPLMLYSAIRGADIATAVFTTSRLGPGDPTTVLDCILQVSLFMFTAQAYAFGISFVCSIPY